MSPSEDDYWVGPTIGEGSFGHVVYAVHKATEQKVAIKVMEVPNTRQGNVHRRNQQQQKTQMILNERHLLSLPAIKSSRWTVDLWAAFLGKPSSSTQCLYFVMKLATGGDLSGLIKRGLQSSRRRSWRQRSVPWYASQLIQAVEFLHSQGIWHCDLKPENLLLDATTGNLMLADFGCAFDTNQSQQRQSHPRGTALYAAPELLRASDELTVAVDYWSVGCILHAMLYGSSPFDRGSEALTVEAIVGYDGNLNDSSLPNTVSSIETSESWEDLWDSDPIQQLASDLLVIDADDRINAWKDKALSFLTVKSAPEGIEKDVLLPIPEWQEQVDNAALRDGSLGWLVFQI